MKNFLEMIKTRRSIRSYEEKEIPEDAFLNVLEAVKWSPSWANTQCWEIIIIKDNEIREKLQKTIGPKNPATKAIVTAPVLIGLCGKLKSSGYYNGELATKFGDWAMFDLGIVTQNISLTAHKLGLATVTVGLFDHENAKKILQIPNEYELFTLMPIGYPKKIPKSTPKRKEIKDFVHYETF